MDCICVSSTQPTAAADPQTGGAKESKHGAQEMADTSQIDY